MTSTSRRFDAVVHAEVEGGYWAEVPELPGCFTQGDTLDEAYHNLTEAIACHLDLDCGLLSTRLKQTGLSEEDL